MVGVAGQGVSHSSAQAQTALEITRLREHEHRDNLAKVEKY